MTIPSEILFLNDGTIGRAAERQGIEMGFPEAKIRSSSSFASLFGSRLWWLTLISGIVTVFLFVYSQRNSGDLISIAFRDGHGLVPEDRLKFRGIDVGIVEKIELNKTNDGILVHVRLTPQSRSMAKEGAKLWIVHPSVSIHSVQGLDTIFGAKYIGIEPSELGAKSQKHFVGLEFPPLISAREGSLEISLDASTRGGLENGAPIHFRGFQIGNVVQVSLASDARSVDARCAIDPEYRDLVRKNSKFWNRSGWRLDIGLSGVKLDADTLAQVLSGGIEMATPTEPSDRVSTGYRFVLYEKPEPEWASWQPSLAHGPAWSRMESKMPQPIRIALRWQERSFGFRKNVQKLSWCLPLSDGSLLCLSEQVTEPKSALAESTLVELSGVALRPSQLRPIQADTEGVKVPLGVERFLLADSLPSEIVRWPMNKLAAKLPDSICDVIIAHSDSSGSKAVDAARLRIVDGKWEIDESVILDADDHGLPVVSALTSDVIGMLSIGKGSKGIIGLSH